jgi:hypothetical protein
MLWNDSYNDYETEMMTKYEDIQGKFDSGAINMEEYDEEISNTLPNPADEYYSCKLHGLKNLYFSFSNNPNEVLLKSKRMFSARVALFDGNGQLLDIINQHHKNGSHASYKFPEGYIPNPNIDAGDLVEEEILKIKLYKMGRTSDVKYALIYLWAKNVDLANLNDLKIAQYRLFNRDSGINFYKGKFSKAMDNLFLINPEEYPEPEEGSGLTRNCIVGCFLVYWDEGKGVGYDHLKSFGIDNRSEKGFLKVVG